MKKIIFLGLILVSGITFGQSFRTGDTELDASLKIVNTDGNKDLSAFKLNLTQTFNVPMPKVEATFRVGMSPGDALMAFQISNITRRPIEDVITVYKRSKSKGWGAMAKEMGIKPGSAEFHALKGKVKEKSKGNGKPKASGSDKKDNSGDKGKSNGNSGGSSKGGGSGKSNGNGKGKK
ncbi:MAG: hypothetical protein K0S23_3730 [Fluviicola sp.]|jgi:hypothetical protein|uniref:hypothetical protein n=1 Tax=Fluviicola sp. TaxID=1917219 RepID=UPI00262E9798|nr:hypothetical protein [Fluviicola sp.]MDF3029423.1 hypothetical protein [Fluviicola sp.]